MTEDARDIRDVLAMEAAARVLNRAERRRIEREVGYGPAAYMIDPRVRDYVEARTPRDTSYKGKIHIEVRRDT